MLSIKLKHISDDIDIGAAISEYANTLSLDKQVMAVIDSAIQTVKGDREKLRNLPQTTEQKYVDLLTRHYKNSVLLTNQIPWDSKIMNKIMRKYPKGFSWADRIAVTSEGTSLSKCPQAYCSTISLDALSCLYNLGALYSYHGSSRNKVQIEELSAASNDFFTAAFYFSKASEYVYNYSNSLSESLTMDISPQVLKALSHLMIAQGVETLACRINLCQPKAIVSVTQHFYNGASKIFSSADNCFQADQLANYLPAYIQFVPRLQAVYYALRRAHELAAYYYEKAVDCNTQSVDSDTVTSYVSAAMYFMRDADANGIKLEDLLAKPQNQKAISSLPSFMIGQYRKEIEASNAVGKQVKEIGKIYNRANPALDAVVEYDALIPEKIRDRMSMKVFLENNKDIADSIQIPDDETNPFRDLVNKNLISLADCIPNDVYKEVQRLLAAKITSVPAFTRFNTIVSAYNNTLAPKNKLPRLSLLPAVLLQTGTAVEADKQEVPNSTETAEEIDSSAVDDSHNEDYKQDIEILKQLIEAMQDNSLVSADASSEKKLAQILGSDKAADNIVKSANLVGSFPTEGEVAADKEGENTEENQEQQEEEEPEKPFDEKDPLSLLSGDIAELKGQFEKVKSSLAKSFAEVIADVKNNEEVRHKNILMLSKVTEEAIRSLAVSDDTNVRNFQGGLNTTIFRNCLSTIDKQVKNIITQLDVSSNTCAYVKTNYTNFCNKHPKIESVFNGSAKIEQLVMNGVEEEIRKAKSENEKVINEKKKAEEAANSTLSPKEQKELEKRRIQDEDFEKKLTDLVEKLNEKAKELMIAIGECRLNIYEKTASSCPKESTKIQGLLKDAQFYLSDKNNSKKSAESISNLKSLVPTLAQRPDFYIYTLRELSTDMASSLNAESSKLSKIIFDKESLYTSIYGQLEAVLKNRKKVLDDRARVDSKSKKSKNIKPAKKDLDLLDPTDRGMAVAMNNIEDISKALEMYSTVYKYASDLNVFYDSADQTIRNLQNNTRRINEDYKRDVTAAADNIANRRISQANINSGSGYIDFQ